MAACSLEIACCCQGSAWACHTPLLASAMRAASMFIDFLSRAFREFAPQDAIVWNGRLIRYAEIGERLSHWTAALNATKIVAGSVVVLEGDFSPNSIALL